MLFDVGDETQRKLELIQVKNNKIIKVLNENWEVATSLSDIDKDGNPDLVVRSLLEYTGEIDSLDAHWGTYNPFCVYTIYNGFCKVNDKLSKKYNVEHYVYSNANFKNWDKIKVLYPRNGSKPRIIK